MAAVGHTPSAKHDYIEIVWIHSCFAIKHSQACTQMKYNIEHTKLHKYNINEWQQLCTNFMEKKNIMK